MVERGRGHVNDHGKAEEPRVRSGGLSGNFDDVDVRVGQSGGCEESKQPRG